MGVRIAWPSGSRGRIPSLSIGLRNPFAFVTLTGTDERDLTVTNVNLDSAICEEGQIVIAQRNLTDWVAPSIANIVDTQRRQDLVAD